MNWIEDGLAIGNLDDALAVARPLDRIRVDVHAMGAKPSPRSAHARRSASIASSQTRSSFSSLGLASWKDPITPAAEHARASDSDSEETQNIGACITGRRSARRARARVCEAAACEVSGTKPTSII